MPDPRHNVATSQLGGSNNVIARIGRKADPRQIQPLMTPQPYDLRFTFYSYFTLSVLHTQLPLSPSLGFTHKP